MTTPADNILEIASSWSFWDRPIPPTVHRTVVLPEALHPELALIVQGVRRCGKSTLLQQLIARYQLDKRDCLFLNFEDPRLCARLDYTLLDDVVAAFAQQRGEDAQLVFLLDEIQWVQGWERWLRTQLDKGVHRFVVTGSNAHLLSGELATTLTGRQLAVELQPFSLREARGLLPKLTTEDYLQLGGFPGALKVRADGPQLLRTYFSDIVTRDVRERVAARSAKPVLQVAQMAFEAAGSELSYRRVAAAAGIAIETAKAYLDACEAAYLLYRCPFFAWSERKRSARNAKFYPVDAGLRQAVVSRSGADRGKSLECATFAALKRAYSDVYYWRGAGPGQGEVDFVVMIDGQPAPVQVSWNGELPRHQRALELFYEAFGAAAEPMFVSADNFEAVFGAS